jgi:hypothetical protein
MHQPKETIAPAAVEAGAPSRVSEKLERAASALLGVAHQLEEDGMPRAGQWAAKAAGQVERVDRYFRDTPPSEILNDAGDFVRRHPGPVIAGAFVAGFLGARFIKSTSTRTEGFAGVYDEDFR